MEVECLGACVNAPMLQIGSDFYEDIDGPITEQMIADLRAGKALKPGPQNSRTSSEPEGGATTLTDAALYDGSVIGKYKVQAPPPPPPANPRTPGADLMLADKDRIFTNLMAFRMWVLKAPESAASGTIPRPFWIWARTALSTS